ncbi:hypothetical protein BJ170DRAFT_720804 [Xylariales sp. AK1849]|nr:hypothetical protein BJ170DRAFT_720804 [Xylariales sp. AK1849]
MRSNHVAEHEYWPDPAIHLGSNASNQPARRVSLHSTYPSQRSLALDNSRIDDYARNAPIGNNANDALTGFNTPDASACDSTGSSGPSASSEVNTSPVPIKDRVPELLASLGCGFPDQEGYEDSENEVRRAGPSEDAECKSKLVEPHAEPELPKGVLKGTCCGHVRFYITRPSTKVAQITACWPGDLDAEHAGDDLGGIDPEDRGTWWPRAQCGRNAGKCFEFNRGPPSPKKENLDIEICDYAEEEVHANKKDKVPLTEDDLEATEEPPRKPKFFTIRAFCIFCGVMVFTWTDRDYQKKGREENETYVYTDDVVRVIWGLLRAPEGRRAEKRLEGCTRWVECNSAATGGRSGKVALRARGLIEAAEKGLRESTIDDPAPPAIQVEESTLRVDREDSAPGPEGKLSLNIEEAP